MYEHQCGGVRCSHQSLKGICLRELIGCCVQVLLFVVRRCGASFWSGFLCPTVLPRVFFFLPANSQIFVLVLVENKGKYCICFNANCSSFAQKNVIFSKVPNLICSEYNTHASVK